MYEAYFKLKSRPFLPAPVVSRYFPAATIESARQTLLRTIERCAGPGLLIGPAGTGKSLLCRLLAEHFAGRLSVVLLDSGRIATHRALLQEILYRLNLPYRGLDEGELRLSLLDFLEPKPASSEGLLLLVDEAHSLSLRLLEELRMLTNLVRDGKPRVSVVLAGSSLLEERFASPKLSSFSQRMAARAYLEPLDAAETASYVRAQISACGGDAATLIDEPALSSVYRASDGIPRLINQICDHALILASLGGVERLTSEAIEEAWADLQQLPPPHTILGAEADAANNVVEFGSLEDEEDDLPKAIPFSSATRTAERATSADEQLDAIEHRLSEIDQGFESSFDSSEVAHGQVSLEFCPRDKASLEEFAEEEVVLDRYASDYEIFAEVPRVTAWHAQTFGTSAAGAGTAAARSRAPESRPAPASAADASSDSPSLTRPVAAYSGGPTVSPPTAAAPIDEPRSAAKSPIDEQRPATLDVTPKKEYKQLFARLRRS
jgi:type II secretory pathway predicted ATPase ExeA